MTTTRIKDHPSVRSAGRSFQYSCGLERDDLLQEARIAYLRAERAEESGAYDPRKSCFDTYATNAVFKGMLTLKGRRSRDIPNSSQVALDPGWEDEDGAPVDLPDPEGLAPDHRLRFADAIRELPDDARLVVELVLSDAPGEVVDAVLSGVKGAAEKLRSYVRQTIGPRLRRGDRADDAFDAIAQMLASL